jgi:DNA-binding NtrC family response regulator
MLRLVARYRDQVLFFPLVQACAVIGSAPENDIVLPFPGVSRRHARFQTLGRELLFVDLDSKNGLVHAGERLPQVLLSPGAEVRLGRISLLLEELASSEAEVALSFAVIESPAGGAPPSSTTSPLTPQPPRRSARAALRFVRDVERSEAALDPWDPRMGAARRILGAETLLVFRSAGDDMAVLACHGGMPPESLSQALVERSPAEGVHRIELGGEIWPVLLGGHGKPGSPRLAAVFPSASAGPSDWERDFFDYLIQHLTVVDLPAPVIAEARRSGIRWPKGMVLGESRAFAALQQELEVAARCRLDVLLLGETGTGKELLARAIHDSGPTAGGPFLAINCAAIPAELMEAELFGVQARVATGVDPRPGLFVQAQGGTIFLDEVGELPEGLQAKLLRVLQEREVLSLGASAPKKIDARVVSASNRDLAALAAAGRFRPDLYYRLRRLEIRVPPLRERIEDLPRLAGEFAARATERYGKRALGISRRALTFLLQHSWPGNIRELEDEVERAVLLCPDGGVLESRHFTIRAVSDPSSEVPALRPPPSTLTAQTLQERVDALEREAIARALAASGGNKTQAARALGLTRNGLNLKLKRLERTTDK